MWYVKMIAVQELEAQVKGFVSIFYNLDICEHEPQYMEAMKRVKRVLTDSLPYRNVAVHYCLNDPRMMRALAIFKLVTGKNHRLRFRTHYGMFEIPHIDKSKFSGLMDSHYFAVYYGMILCRVSRRVSLCSDDFRYPKAIASC